MQAGALDGLLVVERAGRVATAACASLLATLGARVIRLEPAGEDGRLAQAPVAQQLLHGGGKERVQLALDSNYAQEWRRVCTAADVVILDPALPEEPDAALVAELIANPGSRVVCSFTPCGAGVAAANDLALRATDPLLQAYSGLMAITGEQDGRPEFVRVPVAELTAALVATTSVLAALRVRDRDGPGQLVDISIVEIMAEQLRTHVPIVLAGQTRGFRIGCRHPLVAPWNAFHARDGWLLICAASNEQWRALLTAMGRSDLFEDARFATPPLRREHIDAVDEAIQQWVAPQTIDEVCSALEAIGIPGGPAQNLAQVVADPTLRDCGTVRAVRRGDGGTAYAAGSAFHLSRTPARAPAPLRDAADALPAGLAPRAGVASGPTARPPLAGVRVVELSRYAAGPLAGLVLASLGAEVIKIESPGGEDCRVWKPQFGNVSGYFTNFNAGKRSLVLDLREPAQRSSLAELIAQSDVVLQNLRPGVMERMGFGAEQVTKRHRRVVYASVSGFGARGPKLAALDTVMQGRLGLTALAGDGHAPLRIGYSIADQLAGYHAAAGILAALAERDRSGLGQIVDIAMADAMAWITQLAWERGADASAYAQLEAGDGWIVAEAGADRVAQALTARHTHEVYHHTRRELVRALASCGISAAPVLEVDEVLAHPVLAERGSIQPITTRSGGQGCFFAVPLGLTLTPVVRPGVMHDLGEDNAGFMSGLVEGNDAAQRRAEKERTLSR